MGTDLDPDAAYKIHLLYNIQASAAAASFATLGQAPTPGVFSWDLTGTPAQMFGIRPTSHISLDSYRMDSDLLATLEGILYGTTETDPSLPDLVDLLGMVGS